MNTAVTVENKLTWDLESIFPGGSDSEAYAEFLEKINNDIKYASERYEQLPKKLTDSAISEWVDYLLLIQDLIERIDHAGGFVGCLTAQDVKDDKARLLEAGAIAIYGQWQILKTGVEDFLVKIADKEWNKILSQDQLADTNFYWNEVRQLARLKMEPKLEKLAIELAVDGYHAWDTLYNKIAGDLKTEVEENGEKKIISMGQLSTKFVSPDRDTRRLAFEKLENTWKDVEGITSMTLNNLAGFRLTLYKNRQWESPLTEALLMCRLQEKTLNAMWDAIAAGLNKMTEYIEAKKRALGINNFRWYDQLAPMGRTSKTYSYDEACDFVVKHLTDFSSDIGEFARMAIDKRWIEAEDRPGKAAGGFCTGLDIKKESRIFMTFSGSYEEMMTLAHELGHAYHSWVLRDRDYFARQYPMNLAETASTFNELVVTDAALSTSKDEAEKIVLLDQKIQQGFIMFCNIRARYLFDCRFYEERKKGNVSKERLSELMSQTQREAFGSILSDDGLHPLFWASKLHFFISDIPFYNFPYTFGLLFAGGIYDRACREGSSFAGQYKALLADTGSMSTEDVAQKHLGVDLTQRPFWDDAVRRILSDIDPFIELARNFKG